LAKQVASPASDIENPLGGWHTDKSQVHRAISELVTESAEPAVVIAWRALAERRHIAMTGHADLTPAHNAAATRPKEAGAFISRHRNTFLGERLGHR